MGLSHDTLLLLDQLVARFLLLLPLHELLYNIEEIINTKCTRVVVKLGLSLSAAGSETNACLLLYVGNEPRQRQRKQGECKVGAAAVCVVNELSCVCTFMVSSFPERAVLWGISAMVVY